MVVLKGKTIPLSINNDIYKYRQSLTFYEQPGGMVDHLYCSKKVATNTGDYHVCGLTYYILSYKRQKVYLFK